LLQFACLLNSVAMVAEFIWFHRLHFKLVVMVVDDIAFLPAEFVVSAVLQIFSLNIELFFFNSMLCLIAYYI